MNLTYTSNMVLAIATKQKQIGSIKNFPFVSVAIATSSKESELFELDDDEEFCNKIVNYKLLWFDCIIPLRRIHRITGRIPNVLDLNIFYKCCYNYGKTISLDDIVPGFSNSGCIEGIAKATYKLYERMKKYHENIP